MKRSITHALLCVFVCLLATPIFGQSVSISTTATAGTLAGSVTQTSTATALSCNGGPATAPTTFPTIWTEANITGTQTTTLNITITFTGFPASAITTGNVRLLTVNGTNVLTGATVTAPSSATSTTVTFNGVVMANGDRYSIGFVSNSNFRDYGDAPNTYATTAASSGASHSYTCGNLYLGTGTSYFSNDASVYPAKDADDNAFPNGYLPILYAGTTSYSITVPLANTTGTDATLIGWIDFNHDGVFQSSEAATANVVNNATSAVLTFNASAVTYVGQTWARFRISTSPSLTTSTPGGNVSGGEVEDYLFAVSDKKVCGPFTATYITGTGGIGFTPVTTTGTSTNISTTGSGRNEFGSNNDNNLFYYANGTTFYWYDPIANTEGTLQANVASLGTVPFSTTTTTSGGPLIESAGYYFNNRMYFTLDHVNGTTTDSGSRGYFYSFDLADGGKSIVANSLVSYGYIDSADHGDFVIVEESGVPVIYDISGIGTIHFRKISNLAALAGNTGVIPTANITDYTLATSGTGVTSPMPNGQLAYDDATGNFYSNQGLDLLKITLSGTTATRSVVRTNAFPSTPFDMGNNICIADMGDLPTNYPYNLVTNNGAQHNLVNSLVKLGTTVTSDENGKPDANSNGDTGDDGSPTFPTSVTSTYVVSVKYTKTATTQAFVTAWIDFNNNGTFDAGEQSATTTIPAATTGTLFTTVTFTGIPVGTTVNNKFARFRISTNSASVQSPTGYAPDGEVEDYKITATGVPLDVKLISFNAQAGNHNSLLSWTTANEKNSSYFDVEHSADGRTFTKIGDVKAQGTTEISHDYSYTHTTPVNGVNYYRLKMVDQDGSYKYSEVRTVRFGDLSAGVITVAPNPTTGRTRITLPVALSDNGTVIVYNNIGMTVAKMTAAGMQSIDLDLSNQPTGLYHVVVMDGNDAVYRDKIVKQ